MAKPPLGLRDDKAGVYRRNLTKRGVGFLFEVLELAVVGAKLAAQLLPGNDEHGKPEIFNTDQGSQFTSVAFTDRLKQEDIRISMDGKGRWRDNVYIERFWRTIKYDEIYLHAYEGVSEARSGIGRFIAFYNEDRPHSSLQAKTPDQVYFNRPLEQLAA